MILQVHSDGLSAILGFDIEDIAVQTVDMEWIEQNNTQFVRSFCTSITASLNALFRLLS